jgi:FPC/CPF motif-containing protein YcgG
VQRVVGTTTQLWRRVELDARPDGVPEWGRRAFRRFSADVESAALFFPCVFGVEAFREDGLRFVFVESDDNPEDLEGLAHALAEFVRTSPDFGRYVSLVAFFGGTQERDLDEWEDAFWRVLQLLHEFDPEPWPDEIPMEPEDDQWEFCLAGTPMFVVCNTPAHRHRRSRNGLGLTITFQPRWVFQGIEGHTPAGQKSRRTIRARIDRYDTLPPSPRLGVYGAAGNREWQQYFLPDDNETPPRERCPLHIVGDREGG